MNDPARPNAGLTTGPHAWEDATIALPDTRGALHDIPAAAVLDATAQAIALRARDQPRLAGGRDLAALVMPLLAALGELVWLLLWKDADSRVRAADRVEVEGSGDSLDIGDLLLRGRAIGARQLVIVSTQREPRRPRRALVALTRLIARALALVGIGLEDHVIWGRDRHHGPGAWPEHEPVSLKASKLIEHTEPVRWAAHRARAAIDHPPFELPTEPDPPPAEPQPTPEREPDPAEYVPTAYRDWTPDTSFER